MSAVDNQPSNPNFLSQLGFKFSITNYFVQGINLPGMNLGETQEPSPFVRIPVPGDHLSFNELVMTFRVDEDMRNYLELHDWLRGLGFPDNFQQYKALNDQTFNEFGSGEGILSDASLMILNSAMNPNIEVTFEDVYISSLSDLDFTYSGLDVDYITCTANFRYKIYKINRL